jgi:hypothetical protein
MLATGSKDKSILVYNLSKVILNDNSPIMYNISGHNNSVI